MATPFTTNADEPTCSCCSPPISARDIRSSGYSENVLEVMSAMRGHHWVLALGGHMHTAETLVFQTEGVPTHFEQAAAVVGPNGGDDLIAPSGITLYTVRNGSIDSGRFIRRAPPAKPSGR